MISSDFCRWMCACDQARVINLCDRDIPTSIAGDDGALCWMNDFASSCSSFSSPVRPCISLLECLVFGAVTAEDGALELLLLEAMKTVVTLVVTLVYCFSLSSFYVSSAQDINDGEEDVSQVDGGSSPVWVLGGRRVAKYGEEMVETDSDCCFVGVIIRKTLSTLFKHSANKDTLRIAWFLLVDAIYAEDKVIGGEPAST
ncbi:hypothetical protein NC653_034453 [Populus alba x Populus x berolinensis]|uniref:Uncharacterized protein n=1 Tax=Populus alba x Populus x berolinensis TaxID=444605 RepID=A0AAD6LMK3_9ROSI|nr:hypothetical protein NC653_034453 [Populus alba x Populus x berolinensis]